MTQSKVKVTSPVVTVKDMFDVGNLLWLQSSRSAVSRNKTPIDQHTDSAAAGDAVVMVNGALVNINSVLQNLHRSEDERAQVENELKNVEQECGACHLCSLFLFIGSKSLS